MAVAARLGGTLSLVVSCGLAIVAYARDSINALSMTTVVLGILGGFLVLIRPRRATLAAGAVVIALGAAPALIGGFGLAYFPSLVAIVVAIVRQSSRRGKR